MTTLATPRSKPWLIVIGLVLMAGVGLVVTLWFSRAPTGFALGYQKRVRSHFDHTPIFTKPFASPQEVTRACLQCHPKAGPEVIKTAHWTWLGKEVQVPGRKGLQRIGKRNLINNFCISAAGNERSCTKCHVGYGWADDGFDFTNTENVDCLVCHERSGIYAKGEFGVPGKEVDLLAVARSVGYPLRDNCSGCHSYGGGGQGVKHGDLDASLLNPESTDDVHMGRLGFLCIDCHQAPQHDIRGRAFSVSVENQNGVDCSHCHILPEHRDQRLNAHLSAVACQTCHIPSFARKLPTKEFWDWSKAGDDKRPEDEHLYLKIKGEFVYDQNLVPEYHWFNMTMSRYLLGDRIDPTGITDINTPLGELQDPHAKIWPFKVHRALQPYDASQNTLATPLTGGAGGYWSNFNWDEALRLGAQASKTDYSGRYGFAKTQMYWPLSHMVAPAKEALRCVDCHGAASRMNWRALGYQADPMLIGGRP